VNRREFLKTVACASGGIRLGLSSRAADAPHTFILSAPLTHSDWMLKPQMAWGPDGVRHMLNACKESGWSRVYWRVLDGGRALYRSRLLRPMGRWDADNFWNPQTESDKALLLRFTRGMSEAQRIALRSKFDALDYATFDPLGEAVRYGHEIGLQIHAWISINEDDHGWGLQSEFSKANPQFRWCGRNGKAYRSQLSFAFPEVRRYKLAIVEELLAGYALDGLFLDWIRTGDVRDNPQNDASGVADYGYEAPLLARWREASGGNADRPENGDDKWVKIRAEPQTIFMRDLRNLVSRQTRMLPVAALVGHPWHYRGERNRIDGNLRGLLLDVGTWARLGLIDAIVPAGYYMDGGDAEAACRALRKETEERIDVWMYQWVPSTIADAERAFESAARVEAKQILFWEADYIDDRTNAAELKENLRAHAA
jgi:hypothetical protein